MLFLGCAHPQGSSSTDLGCARLVRRFSAVNVRCWCTIRWVLPLFDGFASDDSATPAHESGRARADPPPAQSSAAAARTSCSTPCLSEPALFSVESLLIAAQSETNYICHRPQQVTDASRLARASDRILREFLRWNTAVVWTRAIGVHPSWAERCGQLCPCRALQESERKRLHLRVSSSLTWGGVREHSPRWSNGAMR